MTVEEWIDYHTSTMNAYTTDQISLLNDKKDS
ncbi:hypothetical protein IIK_05440 [Bacillus cereus VD102]|nr:hypothetical protein IIK_05440 [Bacillus cereus VD102]SCC32750.1 Uncharacterized protein BC0861_03496 [Bacillus mobilis]SME55513.1 hypothetical protein BACERE00183_06458 [Bacillus cereus]